MGTIFFGKPVFTPDQVRGRLFPDHALKLRARYYLMAEATLMNVPFKVVPIASVAARITIETNPAIRAYSMAVAPDSSLPKRVTITAIARRFRIARRRPRQIARH
jgi:hypothetical protein